MAITPLTSPWKKFTFAGHTSAEFGVIIKGEGVFNAPERDVEVKSIPGRNGAYILDHGRFENITISYPCTLIADTVANFASAISGLRNHLCSQIGYCRLEDDYHTDEYRMAVYKSGLELDEEQLLKMGEFTITFECKPQRFLTSGESKTTVTSGGTITNPTLFPSNPMLEAYGYGTINIGGQKITVYNKIMGNVILLNSATSEGLLTKTITIDDTYANSGDAITVSGLKYKNEWVLGSGRKYQSVSVSGDGSAVGYYVQYAHWMEIEVTINAVTFNYGTSGTKTVTATVTFDNSTTNTITVTLAYDGADEITMSSSSTITSPDVETENEGFYRHFELGSVTLNSSKSILGAPLYIDLDIGEVYKIENNVAVSVNSAASLPAELPKLPSGATTITFDNTFTKLDIVPRWWRI